MFNEHHYPGEVDFATELDADLKLFSNFLRIGLFHYGPPLWRLGHTEFYQRLSELKEDLAPHARAEESKLWKAILARCTVRTLDPGVKLFKVRKGEALPPAIPSQFDTSPSVVTGGSRYESPTLRMFYGADDVETCLHESRVTLADWIAVATLTPKRTLRVLDIAKDIDDSLASTPFDRVDLLMKRLAFAGTQDYGLCRDLAKETLELGLDGLYFTSYFAQAHAKELRNIALFGFPIAEEKLELISVNRIRLTSMSYEYAFAPPNDTAIPIERDEARRVAAKLAQGGAAAAEAQKELEQLIERKSSGPR